jgi:glutamate N-acetyltransferase/amino-acid N-acetyltransferase
MITVPKGFRFAAARAGFKYKDRDDLGLILSDTPCACAGVFTRNRFKAAPVLQCREILAAGGPVRGVLVNAGQANACTGEEGLINCRVTLDLAGKAVGVEAVELLPASTGVIGPQLPMEKFRQALPDLVRGLDSGQPVQVAKAMMTTDKFPKLAWGRLRSETGEARILGMAKGAGMIAPDMATLLVFVVTDAEVEPGWWQTAVKRAADNSFNRITVDGDTSTNDTLLALAGGASGFCVDTAQEKDAFYEILEEVCQGLAYMVVEDAEGGTRVVRIQVGGAADDFEAELAARAVADSPLVKTAMFGRDPNWGRIVAAIGRSGADFDPDQVSLRIGGVSIFENGRPLPGDMDALLAPHMNRADITVDVILGSGSGASTVLASDLTHEYVSINADYRT